MRTKMRNIVAVSTAAIGLQAANVSFAQDEDVDEIKLASTADPAAAIVCQIRMQYPHASMHVPGSVDVKGSIECNTAMPTMLMDLGLYYYGFGPTQHFATLYDRELKEVVFDTCKNGDWNGVLDWYLEYPPGYRRVNDRGSNVGRSVYVQCRGAAGTEGGGSGGGGGGGWTEANCECEGFKVSCGFICSGRGGRDGTGSGS